MLKIKLYIIFMLLLSAVVLYSKPSSTQGRHFFIGFMQNEIPRSDLEQTTYFSIFISATKSDTVKVKIPNLPEEVYILNTGQVHEIKVPAIYEIINVGLNKNKLIEISSKTQLIVWAYSSKNQSSDAYVTIPVGGWGNEYRVISMGNDMYNGKQRLIDDGCINEDGYILDERRYKEHLTPRSSEFLIMASLDNTYIEYYPTCDTRNGVSKGNKGAVVLNAGECFLVQGNDGNVYTNDLTGTFISSNNPIGVISGHVRTAIKQGLDNPYDTKDHLADMIPPIKAWGKNFISVPFVDGTYLSTSANIFKNLCISGDLIKVIASENNTILNYSIDSNNSFIEKVYTFKNAGDCFEFESASPVIWSANKPVMITQMMMHKGYDNESFYYDPAIVVLTPIEQYLEETTFTAPSNTNIYNQYSAHCFIAISDSIGIYNLTLNGVTLNSENTGVWCKQIGNSKYYWLMRRHEKGIHKVVCRQGNFSGIIYGHGFRDSYAMTLGARLNDPFNIDTVSPLVKVDSNCGTFNISISDIAQNDPNATGIEWGSVNNIVNYNVSEFIISDTSTIINITAKPIDSTKDGSFDIEFTDYNCNSVKEYFSYVGFNVEHPIEHNFGMLKWNSPTEAILYLKNNSNKVIQLLNIDQPTDSRLKASVDYNLPHFFYKNDTIFVNMLFTPNNSLADVNSKVTLVFDCNKIVIPLLGKISAPGLVADSIDFEKVRLYDKKILDGKIHNAGNISVLIEDVKKDINEPDFTTWEYSKTFPNDLSIGDNINYSIEFIPKEERYYVVNCVVENDNTLDCGFYVKGIGGKPNIENIELNWGKRRIGTKNDTTIYIVNSGSFIDTINYKENISITHSSDLSVNDIKKIQKIIINEQDSIPVNYSFIPNNTIPLENVFWLESNWNYHSPIITTFTGQGTMPECKAYNYDFGVVPIFSKITQSHNCVYSFGNEALTIDSIVLISSNTNSFVIGYETLYDLIVEPDDYLQIPITFNPTSKGEHKISLEITHDANPNYQRSKDTIHIYGVCVTENTDLIATLEIPTLYSCITDEAILRIRNIGDANIIIDSILLFGQPNIFASAFTNAPQNTLPVELQPNREIYFPINIYAERDKKGVLTTEIFYNAENKIILSEKIEPITTTIASNIIISPSILIPGDTLHLLCQSNILQKSENNFEYKITLNIDKKTLFCLEEKCLINIDNNNFYVDIMQYIDRVEFALPTDYFELNNQTTMQFELHLLVMLAKEKETIIDYELISDRCYYSNITNIDIKVSPVCMDSSRVLLFDNFPYATINSNPANNEIDLKINLLENDDITIIIYDLLGNEIYKSDNNAYTKGIHNINIELNDIADGIYILETRSNTINTNIKIIINR